MRDDLGHRVRLEGPVRRVVSLVPSLTEAVAATRPGALVGATDWCVRPARLDVARVRGTKNPDVAAVVALEPDVVVANKEENREIDVRRLRAEGVQVWVTDIETVPGAVASMGRLFDACGWGLPAWLGQVESVWGFRPLPPRARVAVAVWRDPWLVVGRPTFTADLLSRLGLTVVSPGATGRYPHVDPAALDDPSALDAVLLPDEPYPFTPADGPDAFARVPTVLVDGRHLTWYGPALLESHARLVRALAGIPARGVTDG